MGINIVRLIEGLLVEADLITNVNDPKHWLKRVCVKINQDLHVEINDEKLSQIYRIFAGKPGTYIAGKFLTDTYMIAAYDLLHTLLGLIYSEEYGTLPWKGVAGTESSADSKGRLGFVNIVQERFQNDDKSPVSAVINNWLNSNITEEDYKILSPRIAKAYMEAKKELATLETAVFDTYKNETILGSLLSVIEKRTSAKERFKAGVTGVVKQLFRRDNVRPFEGLIVSIMKNPASYASGQMSGEYLGKLSEEVDDLYAREIITYVLLCFEFFKKEISVRSADQYKLTYPKDTEVGPEDVEFLGTKDNLTNTFLKFVREGVLEGEVVITSRGSDVSIGAINKTKLQLKYNKKYTLGYIDQIQTTESKRVIQAFKAICVYIKPKTANKVQFGSGLWDAVKVGQ